MERIAKILSPTMPDFIFQEMPPRPKQDGFNPGANHFPITDLTEKEAEEYGELMKQTFIQHWKDKKEKS